MARIASGVITRAGTGFNVHADKRLSSVRDEHRDEAMSYSITQVDAVAQPTRRKSDNWEHYTYQFTYRFNGRTFNVTWRCGIGYGAPKPEDGIQAAFLDASTIAHETFGPSWAEEFGMDLYSEENVHEAQRVWNACERVERRLAAFLGEHREAWEEAVAEH